MKEQRLKTKAGLMDRECSEENRKIFEGLTKEGGRREHVAHRPC